MPSAGRASRNGPMTTTARPKTRSTARSSLSSRSGTRGKGSSREASRRSCRSARTAEPPSARRRGCLPASLSWTATSSASAARMCCWAALAVAGSTGARTARSVAAETTSTSARTSSSTFRWRARSARRAGLLLLQPSLYGRPVGVSLRHAQLLVVGVPDGRVRLIVVQVELAVDDAPSLGVDVRRALAVDHSAGAIAAVLRRVAHGIADEELLVLGLGEVPGGAQPVVGDARRAFHGPALGEVGDGIVAHDGHAAEIARVHGRAGEARAVRERQGGEGHGSAGETDAAAKRKD